MSKEAKWVLGIGGCLAALCLFAGLMALGGSALFLTAVSRTTQPAVSELVETPEAWTVTVPEPTATRKPSPSRDTSATREPLLPPTAVESTPTQRPTPSATPTPRADLSAAELNIQAIEEMEVPLNDARDLAMRLKGLTDIPETLPAPERPYQVGDQKKFWAFNEDNRQTFEVPTTLRYVTPHLYFWIEDSVSFNQNDLARLAETFETEIYPTNREFFGSEWSPGIDNDPHLYVVFAGGIGSNVGGYFSSKDEVPPQARSDSNGHEMFFINADGISLRQEYIYSTMAHEFQHMIHWYRDRNETSWINEGFSVLAQLLNGYEIGGSDRIYLRDPDLQLNTWESLPSSVPHYGQSFLFLSYFLDRFGEEVTKALVGEAKNGLEGIDAVLNDLKVTDPAANSPVTADDVFADWTITSFLNDASVGDGRFAYRGYRQARTAGTTQKVTSCGGQWTDGLVHQYGVEYIALNCSGEYTLEFEGSEQASLLPVQPSSGSYAFWSNQGDDSDMTLTRPFDFTGVSGPIRMSYKTWYDIETEYDYVYLLASEDGKRWEMIQTPSGTDANPSGSNFGWGYTGPSGAWLTETVDLSKYAGKKVWVRFEYITDAAVNGEGLLVDDISVSAVDYTADFEDGDGGWEGKGFVRITNALPQTFRVSLIIQGAETSVQYLTLTPDQKISLPVSIGRNEEMVLVVSGTTRITHQEAAFRLRLVK